MIQALRNLHGQEAAQEASSMVLHGQLGRFWSRMVKVPAHKFAVCKRLRESPAEAGYAAAHVTLLGVGLYVDVALTQWNGVFWTVLQNHQSKQFYRPFGSNESAERSMARGFFVLFCRGI